MNKKGTTLLESVISIFIISVVLVLFMESLNIGITGTLEISRKTSALNLAKSQIDHVKNEAYNASAGNLSSVYSLITESENVSDKVNYNISGWVSNVSVNASLQQITVNVSYLHGQQVQMTAYKLGDGSFIEPAGRGLLVTDNLLTVPTVPQGYSWFCSPAFKGYYHVFTSGYPGKVSISWTVNWSRVGSTGSSFGAPMIALYEGIPVWVERDWEGEPIEDGVISRPQGAYWLGSMGDLPGPGNNWMCECYSSFGCESNCSSEEENPILYAPHHCPSSSLGYWACWIASLFSFTGPYPCCGACETGDLFWTYDSSGSSGSFNRNLTSTSNISPGTYTVFFFNSENRINLDTVSAGIAYWK